MFSNSSRSLLVEFSEYYAQIHGRIVFPLTILGILTSIVTITILNRKNFQTPTNLILQHVAFFDTVVLISFNIYSFYFYILHDPNPFVGQSQFWPRFAIFHSNIGLTAHSIALWLTCLLAIIRYTIISRTKQITVNATHVMIFIWCAALVICLLMIPNYLAWSVVCVPAHTLLPTVYTINSTETVYWVSSATGGSLEKISFGILAICLKISPVIILIIFSILLILNIRHARQLRERLRHSSSISSSSNLKVEMRTTTMLVLITLCTVFVELPQGLLLIAIGIDKQFFIFYSHLGDFWDLTSISSSFITFVMYCSMSQQFRLEMISLILPSICIKNSNLKSKRNSLTEKINLKQIKIGDSQLLIKTTNITQDL
ncbi:unnamed protein product [Rotaria magnacalcarata]|uniref:G-protein coupled receptors family 1 profile domain-containing protein n=1 Tax=Rotaria magnacalcarata TaxID=392030 RepID=A0A815TG20_9BILA|nr:unnamed protein product [Rotaria magnacalcarata]CAF1603782.1 unnamed protein product [Rotaria magnacalcarata]CAF2095651.1 unnamed protein product [Rotaria magnacalcarata]CAF2116611.1 unnamed protein product [Rotaria magnacalcarata]CAF2158002.1 unnamed protein product [Rotaria magnacalcarata]